MEGVRNIFNRLIPHGRQSQEQERQAEENAVAQELRPADVDMDQEQGRAQPTLPPSSSDVDVDMDDGPPPLEPANGSHDDVNYDDMPPLEDVSDTDSDFFNDDDMSDDESFFRQGVADGMPRMIPTRRQRSSSGEGVGDAERDRRHPSQRTGDSQPNSNDNNATSNARTTTNNANAGPQRTAAPRYQWMDGNGNALSITLDLGPAGAGVGGGGNNNNDGDGGENGAGDFQLPPFGDLGGAGGIPLRGNNIDTLLDVLMHLGMHPASAPEQPDPERARRLVDAMEEVPIGLIKRLERVAEEGDTMCAICWDKLIDAEAPFGIEQPVVATAPTSADSSAATENSAGAAGTSSSETVKPNEQRIVSLPCAHLFHASCLLPWFSRPKQTTCPSCRFNIDPDNLTWRPPQRRSTRNNVNADAPGAQPGQQQAGTENAAQAQPDDDAQVDEMEFEIGFGVGPPPTDIPAGYIAIPFTSQRLGTTNTNTNNNNNHGGNIFADLPVPPRTNEGSGGLPFPFMRGNSNTNSGLNGANASQDDDIDDDSGPPPLEPITPTSPTAGLSDVASNSAAPPPNTSTSTADAGTATSNGPTVAPARSNIRRSGRSTFMDFFQMVSDEAAARDRSSLAADVPPLDVPAQRPTQPVASTPSSSQSQSLNSTEASAPSANSSSNQAPAETPTRSPPPIIPSPTLQAQAQRQQRRQNEPRPTRYFFNHGTNARGNPYVTFGMDFMIGVPMAGPTDGDINDAGGNTGQGADGGGQPRPWPDLHLPDLLASLINPDGSPRTQNGASNNNGNANANNVSRSNTGNTASGQSAAPGGFTPTFNRRPSMAGISGISGLGLGLGRASGNSSASGNGRSQRHPILNHFGDAGILFGRGADPLGRNGNAPPAATGSAPTPQPQSAGAPTASNSTTNVNSASNATSGNGNGQPPNPFAGLTFPGDIFSHLDTPFARAFSEQSQPQSRAPPQPRRPSPFGAGAGAGTAPPPQPQPERPQQGQQQGQQQPPQEITDLLRRFLLNGLNQAVQNAGGGGGGAPGLGPGIGIIGGFGPTPAGTTANENNQGTGGNANTTNDNATGPGARQQRPPGGFTFRTQNVPPFDAHHHHHHHPHPEPREYVPPPPPGSTVRQRVEKLEREHGVRCWEPSCLLAPADEDETYAEVKERQVWISKPTSSTDKGKAREVTDPSEEPSFKEKVCEHSYHPSCLVSAQRVRAAIHNEEIDQDKDEIAAVCDVCRNVGVVDREVWIEGVQALEGTGDA